jgi:mono/diheme cytochrome c family protein
MRTRWTLALLATVAMACDGQFYGTDPGDQDADTGGDPYAQARQVFEDTVAPILTANCTACHNNPSHNPAPGFLAPPDMYDSIMGYGGELVIPGRPNRSRLYTYGSSPNHPGPSLNNDQAQIVRAWIMVEPEREVEEGEDPGSAETVAFKPVTGQNTIDLSTLGEGLDGARFTFNASPLAIGLAISDITVHAGPEGVRLVHPLFVTWCPSPQPDPIDTFESIDVTVNPSTTLGIGSGGITLSEYRSADCMLSVHFFTLVSGKGVVVGDDELGGACKDVASFTANAQPQLSLRCNNCHTGGNNAATQSYDLRGINNLGEENQKAVCAQTKGKLNFDNLPGSILFARVQAPQSTGHPFTLTDNAQFTQFRDAILVWAENEK